MSVATKPGRYAAVSPHHARDVYTTGQVATICRVAPRTVGKWFDSGRLKGYRIPGSQDRRIPRKQLISFLREHGMPTEFLERQDHQHVLLVGFTPTAVADLTSRFAGDDACRFRAATTTFEAGSIASEFEPDIVMIDLGIGRLEACQVAQGLKSNPSRRARFIAINAGDQRHDSLLEVGFAEIYPGTPDAATLAEEIALGQAD